MRTEHKISYDDSVGCLMIYVVHNMFVEAHGRAACAIASLRAMRSNIVNLEGCSRHILFVLGHKALIRSPEYVVLDCRAGPAEVAGATLSCPIMDRATAAAKRHASVFLHGESLRKPRRDRCWCLLGLFWRSIMGSLLSTTATGEGSLTSVLRRRERECME